MSHVYDILGGLCSGVALATVFWWWVCNRSRTPAAPPIKRPASFRAIARKEDP